MTVPVLDALERGAAMMNNERVEPAREIGRFAADAALLRELREALAEVVATKAELAPDGETLALRERVAWGAAFKAHADLFVRLLSGSP